MNRREPMKVTRVQAENFLSFKSLDLDIANRGLVLIDGDNKTNQSFRSNGSGKTSSISAIVYGFYGVTPNGQKADEVVNRHVGTGMKVVLHFEKDGDKYRIERYRKYPVHRNKVFLFVNDTDISMESMAKTEKKIIDIIGLDFTTAVNSVIFSQGTGAGQFTTATDREKKEILETVVNLSVYTEAQEVAKVHAKEAGKALEVIDSDIEKLDAQYETEEYLEQEEQRKYESIHQQITEQTKKIASVSIEVQANEKDIQASILQTTEQLNQSKQKMDEINKAVEAIGVQEKSTEEQREYEIKQELTQLENSIKNNTQAEQNSTTEYQSLRVAENCPTCGTQIERENVESREAEILNDIYELRVSTATHEANTSTLQAELEELGAITLVQQQERQKAHEVAKQYQDVQLQVSTETSKLSSLQHQLDTHTRPLEVEQERLQTLESIPKPELRETEKAEITKAKGMKKAERIVALENIQNLEDVIVLYGNKGVRSHILDLVTPFLNERVGEYSQILTGSEVDIRFTTQSTTKSGEVRETFDIAIDNENGGDSYLSNSGGERKRIDLAIALALQDLVLSKNHLTTNFALYDEVFDALDEVGCENVIGILKSRLNTVETMFVITHNEHLKHLFEDIITVEKVDGISTIKDAS